MDDTREDPLLPAAYRLALFYALLSPGILQRELGVDRARAERLIEQLVARGALGPVFIERTGARESLVNMVNRRADDADLPPAASLAQATRSRPAMLSTVVGVALGLALCAALALGGLGLRAASLLGLAALSPGLAQIAGLLVLPTGAGWALGAGVERLLGPDEASVPYRALRFRRGLWTGYAALAIGLGMLLLFR